MLIFNKGKRTIGTKEGDLEPQKSLEVSDEEAEKLLSMYPDEININGATVEETLEKDRTIEALTQDKKDLETEIENLKSTISDLEDEKKNDTIAEDLKKAQQDLEDAIEMNDNLTKELKTEKDKNVDLTKEVENLTNDLKKATATPAKGQGK